MRVQQPRLELQRELEALARVLEVAVPRERRAQQHVRLGQRLRDLERVECMARGLLEPAECKLRAREPEMRRRIARIPLARRLELAARLGMSTASRVHARKRKRHLGPLADRARHRVKLRARARLIARKRQRRRAHKLHLDARSVQ